MCVVYFPACVWLSSVARSCATRDANNKDNVCKPNIPAGIKWPPPSKTISPITGYAGKERHNIIIDTCKRVKMVPNQVMGDMVLDGGEHFIPAGIFDLHTLYLLLTSLEAHDRATEHTHSHTEKEHKSTNTINVGTINKTRQGGINSVPLWVTHRYWCQLPRRWNGYGIASQHNRRFCTRREAWHRCFWNTWNGQERFRPVSSLPVSSTEQDSHPPIQGRYRFSEKILRQFYPLHSLIILVIRGVQLEPRSPIAWNLWCWLFVRRGY